MTAPQNLRTAEPSSLRKMISDLTAQLRDLSGAERSELLPELQALRDCLPVEMAPTLASPPLASPSLASPSLAPAQPLAPAAAYPRLSTSGLSGPLLEAIFKADPGGLAVVTVDDLVYQMVNEAYGSLTPNPVVNPLGKRMDDIWLAEDVANARQAFRQVIESGQSLKTEYTRRYEDGDQRAFTAHLVPLTWNNRPAVLIVLWETTELQRVQQYLVESEERFRLALTHTPDLFVIYDASRRIQFLSNSDMVPGGHDLSYFIGRLDEDLWPDPVLESYLPHLLNTYATGQVQRFEMEIDRAGQESVTWLVTLAPMLDDNGQVRQVMAIAHDITERKRAESELRENEAQLHLREAMLTERNAALEAAQDALTEERSRLLAVLEAVPVGLSILDTNGGVLLANKTFEEVWGGPPPPTNGVKDYAAYQAWWAETGQPVQPDEWASAVAVQKGETVRGQFFRIRRFDGTYSYVLNSSAPIRDADGAITGATVAIMDITARVEAEAELLKNEEALQASEAAQREIADRFQAMANNIPQLAWMADPSGWIFWYNQRWYDYTGATPEEMEGWGWQSVHHPDYVQRVTEKFRDHVARGEVWEDTFPIRGKDGQYRWFLSRAIPIRDARGAITRWFGTNTDITEQRESQERFRVAMASVPLLVYTCDRDQRYTWVYNPQRGFTAEEVLGKRDDELLGAEAAAELVAAKQRALDTGNGAVQEVRIPFNDEMADYLLTTEPILDPDGRVVGLTCSAIDITEQRRAAEEQREQRAQVEVQRRLLEYREKERQEIARDLHDGPIQLMAGTIFHLQVAREATQDALMKIELDQAALNLKGAVRELRETVNELRPPALLRFGLTKSAMMHAEDFRERHPEITLAVDMIDDRGLLSEQARLALFRIYQEALSNVIKHSGASRVWVDLSRKDNQVRLEIRDNGHGVELTGDLADQTKRGHFGLAGMLERAQAVGGTLEVASGQGSGMRIIVTVPIE